MSSKEASQKKRSYSTWENKLIGMMRVDRHGPNIANSEEEQQHTFDLVVMTLPVADAMGRGQPACQEEWKMCTKNK